MYFSGGRGQGRGGSTYNRVPPPSTSTIGRGSFASIPPPPAVRSGGSHSQFISSSTSSTIPSSRSKSYFDDDDDDDTPATSGDAGNIDDDYDPLDAFMANVEDQVKREEKTIGQTQPLPEIVSGGLDYDDDMESLEKQYSSHNGDDADDVEYDIDGTPLNGGEKTKVEPLPAVDHSKIDYPPFRKSFYTEHKEILTLSEDDVSSIRESLEVGISGSIEYRPIQKFHQTGFPSDLVKAIAKVGYEKPTAIQAQTLPVALSGKDLIGLAKTGSGKTLSFVWPMIVHILDQPQMRQGDGPIGLILAPTRELATQIHTEARTFAKVYNIRAVAVYGGAGKYEMSKALKEAPEMVVATPGRFIELVRTKATNLQRCTMVVLDEADRMFEMGFEYQMRSIVNNIRPDRQTLLFSATMKRKVEGFAREILTDPVRVVVGTIGQANPDIRQIVEILSDDRAKWNWLAGRADEFIADGKVLIFVSGKSSTEELAGSLKRHFLARQLDVGIDCLHGDKDQTDRSNIMRRFSKTQETSILVATDIASRGLDVKDIRTVVNFDVPKNIETYVHRIGRTGRMGLEGIVPGTAYTLVTSQNGSFAVDLVQNLNLSGQQVPPGLQKMAEADPKWGRIKHIRGKGGIGSDSGGGGKSGHGGGMGPGRAGGIGFGGSSAPRAMTSAMLSSATGGPSPFVPTGVAAKLGFVSGSSNCANISSTSNSSNSSGSNTDQIGTACSTTLIADMAANPYIEGRSMGRGKHLLQPSWAKDAEELKLAAASTTILPTAAGAELVIRSSSAVPTLPAGGMASSGGSENQYEDAVGMSLSSTVSTAAVEGALPVRKRPSRFSAPVADTGASVEILAQSHEMTNAYFTPSQAAVLSCSSVAPPPPLKSTVLSGFVRSSGSYSSVSASAPVHVPVPAPATQFSRSELINNSAIAEDNTGRRKKSRWD